MISLFKKKGLDPLKELKSLLGDFELGSFSTSVMNVLDMIRDPESSIVEIASQIEMDPGMHVKVLRLVNSASFGLAQQVSNLQHAVTLLGRSRIESMVLTFAVSDSLPMTIGCMEMSDFWAAAARRACLARLLAQHMHAATHAESFTAGLFQDMGIPVIAKVKESLYCEMLDEWHSQEDADLAGMEKEKFGYDHPTVGALIAVQWGLPEYIVDAVAGHHFSSDESTSEPAVRLVSLLKYNEEDVAPQRLIEKAQKDYDIPESIMQKLYEQSVTDAQSFSNIFS